MARVPPEPEAIKSASRRQNLTRWAVAYATTDTALFVLCVGIAGLFACLCQFILLRQIQQQVPGLSNQVGAFADKVVAQLSNASEQWAVGTNKAIEAANSDINRDMFGWVEKATNAVNNTLNTFVDETEKVLDQAFGKTPLRDPIQEVLNCLVLLKVQGIQKGLAWVEENAHINFPTLPNDTFSMGALASLSKDANDGQSFLAEPNDEASDKVTAAINRVVEFVEDGIKQEALISTVVVLLWVLTCFIGASYAIYKGYFGRDKARGNGGSVLQRNPTDFRRLESMQDFRSDNQDRFTTDIPLSDIHHSRPFEPAPEYSEAVKPQVRSTRVFDGQENKNQDLKTGPVTNTVNEKTGGFI